MTTKICSKCNLERDVSEFGRHSYTKNGLRSQCKSCEKAYRDDRKDLEKQRIKLWKSSHREAHIATVMRSYYRKMGVEIPEKYRLLVRESLSQDEIISNKNRKNREYKQANSDKVKEGDRKYRQSPAGKAARIRGESRRRLRELNVDNSLTENDVEFLLCLQNRRCAGCGCEFSSDKRYERDHIVPVVCGGGLTLDNVQLLCRTCNASKHNKEIRYIPEWIWII